MAEFVLEANERKTGTNGQLSQIRDSKRVPGVIYGFSQKPISIDLAYLDLLKVLKEAGTSNIISIKVGEKAIKTIVREFQQDPVKDTLTHVDFMAIDDKREITTKVPLDFVGVSSAVREQGGQLNFKNHSVNVRCLPADLPSKIDVDVSLLKELGQKLVISDLNVDDKVAVLNNPNDPIVDVTLPKKIKIEEPVTPVAGEEAKEGEEGEAKEGEAGEAKEGEAKEGEAKEGEEKK